MAEYSDMPVLEVWYASIDVEKAMATIKDKEASRRGHKRVTAARARSVLEHDFPKLATGAGHAPTIKDAPPLIYHLSGEEAKELDVRARAAFTSYRNSLPDDRRLLIDRYAIKDYAIKVVGVGSVGTFCAITLLMASEKDPLFLQVKEARASVLEAYAGKSIYPNHGQRVVNGYRLMQSASDIFLGWATGKAGRHLYVRQLRDMKIGAQTELFSRAFMVEYAGVLRLGARAGARALRCASTDQRLPRQERRLRQGDCGVRQRLRRSKRTRPRNLEEGGALGRGGSRHGSGSIERSVQRHASSRHS